MSKSFTRPEGSPAWEITVTTTRPFFLWFTGLSGAGKSTVAAIVCDELKRRHVSFVELDGDVLREGLNRDLGFSDEDRRENVRRIGEVARLFMMHGDSVVVGAIAPFRDSREQVRSRCDVGQFIEIFVDAPMAETERRDIKGLYARARAGTLANFTGIDSPYETPLNPEVHLHTDRETPEESAVKVLAYLETHAMLGEDQKA